MKILITALTTLAGFTLGLWIGHNIVLNLPKYNIMDAYAAYACCFLSFGALGMWVGLLINKTEKDEQK